METESVSQKKSDSDSNTTWCEHKKRTFLLFMSKQYLSKRRNKKDAIDVVRRWTRMEKERTMAKKKHMLPWPSSVDWRLNTRKRRTLCKHTDDAATLVFLSNLIPASVPNYWYTFNVEIITEYLEEEKNNGFSLYFFCMCIFEDHWSVIRDHWSHYRFSCVNRVLLDSVFGGSFSPALSSLFPNVKGIIALSAHTGNDIGDTHFRSNTQEERRYHPHYRDILYSFNRAFTNDCPSMKISHLVCYFFAPQIPFCLRKMCSWVAVLLQGAAGQDCANTQTHKGIHYLIIDSLTFAFQNDSWFMRESFFSPPFVFAQSISYTATMASFFSQILSKYMSKYRRRTWQGSEHRWFTRFLAWQPNSEGARERLRVWPSNRSTSLIKTWDQSMFDLRQTVSRISKSNSMKAPFVPQTAIKSREEERKNPFRSKNVS